MNKGIVEINKQNMQKISHLFSGIEETLIWSCLQGYMGRAWADDLEKPTCAQMIVGDFAFYVGDEKSELAQ